MGPPAERFPELPDGRIGSKAVDLGLITPHQLREVLAQLAQVAVPDSSDPPSLAEALVRMGLLSQRQVDTLLDDTAARLKRLGKYRIARELGRGAMGVVYQAVDSDLGRTVAIKMLLRAPQAVPDDAALEEERFIREARLSANLPKHPGIVGVYEAGVLEGHHYIAMEFIEGAQFQKWRRKNSPPLRAQISVLLDVAVAVDHAHRHGIIHRDLKPDNVLIDSSGQPHVTDFGLAKQSKQDVSLTLTGAGRAAGTPTYMSPEQAGGRRDVDRRTDVWSLGVMLYEILAGRPPFRGETPVDVMLKIVRDPVQPPSTAIREGTHFSFDKTLENICLKALMKDPKDRYASARAFAEDLGRWLKGKTVVIATVQEPRTNPMLIGIGSVLAIALLVAAAFYLMAPASPSTEDVQSERMARASGLVTQGQRLLREGKNTDALVAFARASELDSTNRAATAGKAEAEQKIVTQGAKAHGGTNPSPSPAPLPPTAPPEAVRKAREYAQFNPKDVDGLVRAWHAARAPALGTTFAEEVNREYDHAQERQRETLRTELADLDQSLSASRTEEHFGTAKDALLLASKRRENPDWESAVRSRLEELQKSVEALYQPLLEQAREAKRKNDAATISSIRARLERWKWAGLDSDLEEALSKIVPAELTPAVPALEGLNEISVLTGHQSGVCGAAFFPNGKSIVTTSFDRTVRLWDVASHTEKAKLAEDLGATSVACSPDGKWITAGFVDGMVRLWDTGKLEARTFAGHGGMVTGVTFSPDSKHWASAGVDGTVRTCDVTTGALKSKFEGHSKGAMSLAYSSDGKLLAVGSADSMVKIWEVQSGHERRVLTEEIEGSTASVSFSPNGKLLASAGSGAKVLLWEVETGRHRILSGHTKEIRGVAFSLDGQWVASASPDGTLRLWNCSTGEAKGVIKDSSGFFGLAFSPKGDFVAGCMGSWTVRVWQTPTFLSLKAGPK